MRSGKGDPYCFRIGGLTFRSFIIDLTSVSGAILTDCGYHFVITSQTSPNNTNKIKYLFPGQIGSEELPILKMYRMYSDESA